MSEHTEEIGITQEVNAPDFPLPRFSTEEVVDPTSGQPNVLEPPNEKKNNGWAFKEFPPRNFFNWLHKGSYLWLKYLRDLMARHIGNSDKESGYVTLPNGTIMQWGYIEAPSGVNPTVAFPIAFPTAVQSITFTPDGNVPTIVSTSDQTLNNFVARATDNDGSAVPSIGYWLAIGR